MLCEAKGEEQPYALKPHKTSFWVRVYDVSINLRLEAVVKQIGNVIGDSLNGKTRERTNGDSSWE